MANSLKSMDVEDYEDDFMPEDEGDIYLDSDEELEEKPPASKRPRKAKMSKNVDDSDFSASEHEADDDFDPSEFEQKPGVKDKECTYCGKKYASEKAMKMHIRKKHSEEGMAGMKKIKCGFCELEFAERRLLTCVSSVENISFYFTPTFW